MVLAAILLDRCDDRHPLAEEPQPHHQQGLREPDLSRAAAAALDRGAGGPFAQNDKLRDVTLIGLGRIEAPEDVILDRATTISTPARATATSYASWRPTTRRWRCSPISAASRSAWRSTAKTISIVCIGGMGLYRITPDGKRWRRRPTRPTAAFTSVNDDSRLRLADDLDIADDGRIFFSEATVRYEMHEWPVDGLEARGNGRIICYDPQEARQRTVLRGLKFPNGICIASDGQSILFAETWGCSIKRYWFDGPRRARPRR
jgi:ribose transport system permease protein